jgi:hypothetical protein
MLVFRKPSKTGSVLGDLMAAADDTEISPSLYDVNAGKVPVANQADYLEAKNKNQHADFNSNDGIRQRSPSGIYSPDMRPPENYDPKSGRYPSQMFAGAGAKGAIDNQSGELKGFSGGGATAENHADKKEKWTVPEYNRQPSAQYIKGDSGGASRILHTIAYEQEEIDLCLYEPKVSGSERNAGLGQFDEQQFTQSNGSLTKIKEGQSEYMGKEHIGLNKLKVARNTHPTLKPINLTWRIAQLFRLPDAYNQQWYNPFSGAGSERIGMHKAGVPLENIACCELDEHWCEINAARTEWWAARMKHRKDLPAKEYLPKEKTEQPESRTKLFE